VLELREEILAKALELPLMERAELIENLFSSFEFSSRKERDVLWAQVAESQIDAFERDEIAAIPVKSVFDEIEKHKNNEN